jgi:uncharacterized membrane protein (UPF0182 family)
MRRWILILVPVVILMAIIFSSAGVYTEWLWFVNLGYGGIFWNMIWYRVLVSLLIGTLAFLFILLNITLVRRHLSRRMRGVVDEDNVRYFPSHHGYLDFVDDFLSSRYVTWGLLGISLGLALLIGAGSSGQWMNLQMFLQSTPFGLADPLFGQDVSYYVFQLPFFLYLFQTFFNLFLMVLLATAGLYFLAGLLNRHNSGSRGAIAHLSGLLACVLGIKAWGYQLDIAQLNYSPRGVAFGASYTDMHASLPIFRVLMWLSIALAIGALANTFLRRMRLAVVLPAALMLLSVLVGGFYPGFVERFSVEPNQLERERPYIESNIKFTRIGFDLDRISETSLPAPAPLTQAALQQNPQTIENVRLLDWRLLGQSYTQLQGIRPYYRFADIDIDRYRIDGDLRQVMLSVREMQLTEGTWLNKHLVYTHGYGAVVSPVNRVDAQGQPLFLMGDIPVRTDVPELQVTVPQVYFGEMMDTYAIVNTTMEEFDYPRGSESNASHEYVGTAGVKLGFFNKLMFSLRFGNITMLLSDSITPDSRILYHRTVMDRVRTIAPFLQYENDPYAVIADGKIYWIVDGFTTSNMFPYSEPLAAGGANYIRNSVKVVVDAYNGSVDFYQADQDDPLIETVKQIFPGLIKPLEQMPASLQAHLRYPDTYMRLQAEVLNIYHMTDPTLFYNREDPWRIAREKYENTERQVEPYYTVMTLPGGIGEGQEFVSILPITPAGSEDNPKLNMIAWLAARNDAEHYGELHLFRFPKETVVQGPMQVEARIDQDTEIAANMTLWSQSGSRVIRGNLLVLPIGNTVIYVEPVYILATGSNNLPELKRVIVATRENVVMRPTLAEGLTAILGLGPQEGDDTDPDQPLPGIDATIQDISQRLNQAWEAFNRAQQNGDWAEMGRQWETIGQLLDSLQQRTAAGGNAP